MALGGVGVRERLSPVSLVPVFLVFLSLGLNGNAWSQSYQLLPCPGGTRGPTSLSSGSYVLYSDCVIEGTLELHGSTLLMVLLNALTVRGDVRLSDDAVFAVGYGALKLDNQFSGQYRIVGTQRALTYFYRSVLETNTQRKNNYFSNYQGFDNSTFVTVESLLDPTYSWLNVRVAGNATAIIYYSDNLPRELTVVESATGVVWGATSRQSVGIWLELGSVTGEIDLPDQTAPFTWSFGRDTPGVQGVGYEISVIDSWPAINAGVSPNSDVTIRGRGGPSQGELTVSYTVVGGNVVLDGLHTGLQVDTQLDGIRLINVDLGSVAWQVYAFNNPSFTIRNSVVNEVAAYTGGKILVENSIIQLALLGAAGVNAGLSVVGSDIWAQGILARNNSVLTILDSAIHGSILQAEDDATIRLIGTELLPNGDGAPCDGTNAFLPNGEPRCNPFLPLLQMPVQITTGNGRILIEP